MYHTCLHCTRDLGRNDVLEELPIGRRIAFDPARGRLWVICRSCAKWNLVPFENRLEAIDACAKLFHDTGTRFSTENIGMARVPEGLELVRIGKPQRPEFASWRYGAQYRRRRKVNMAIGGAGTIGTVAAMNVMNTIAISPSFALDVGISAATVLGITTVWMNIEGWRHRILTRVPGVPGLAKLGMNAQATAHLLVTAGELTVTWSPGPVDWIRKRQIGVAGPDGRLLLRRLLGAVNRRIGSKKDLGGAVARIEAGGVEEWLSRLGNESVEFKDASLVQRLAAAQASSWFIARARPLHHERFGSQSIMLTSIPSSDRLALEMWLSEEDEARALAGELSLLERQWHEAEQLAAIADGLALPSEQTSL